MTESIERTLKEILNEAMDLRGVNLERLAQATEIPERYLIALKEDDYKKLPSAPYVRGYLMKIGEVLDVDGKSLWEIYRRHNPIKSSGLDDKLPINRFAIKGMNKKLIILGFIGVFAVIYLGWRGSDFFGAPKIEVTNPIDSAIQVATSTIKITGTTEPMDKITVGPPGSSDEVLVSGNGRFEKVISLQVGPNTIEIKAKKFLGKEVKITKQIFYQP
ncbi:MAG: helix-turn-helix domain-containing protein [Candidatus Wolfebacteria bacterium]|nr:helix-turn-helix domain-containing protein [Candidatus Wolfebacteria bacterium]